jgi:hypothetical protein
MPTVSIDTFFACSLMILLVLSAMATTSNLLYPQINNASGTGISDKYREVSKLLLLSCGKPANWGQSRHSVPNTFGLAKDDSELLYDLDIDKVTRLNNENTYGLSYAQIFAAAGLPDVSFRIEVKPVFDVTVNLTASFSGENESIYQFSVLTEKSGLSVQTELRCYLVVENYLEMPYSGYSSGRIYFNATLSNSIVGPALLVAFAKSASNPEIVSYGIYRFAHNSAEPEPESTFLRLSPLNYTLNATFLSSTINLSSAQVLTFDRSSVLTLTENSSESATFEIPRLLGASPLVLVVSGSNSTVSFSEWTAYPQIPVQTGADFSSLKSLSDVFAYTFIVTINSAIYECMVWLGGPKQ